MIITDGDKKNIRIVQFPKTLMLRVIAYSWISICYAIINFTKPH